MLSRRFFRRYSRPARGLATAIALVAYLLSVVGVPLPALVTLDTSTPFPCQGHQCGCSSAAQCYQSCCCFAPEERLAFAHEHGVELSEETQLAMTTSVCRDHGNCCDEHQEDCGHEHDAGCTACADSDCETPHAAGQDEHTDGKVVWVHAIQARKCQGIALMWVTSGATLPLAIPTLWEFNWIEVDRACQRADLFIPLCYEPPIRPPRA